MQDAAAFPATGRPPSRGLAGAIALGALLTLGTFGVGEGASPPVILSVPATTAIGPIAPFACATGSTTINVKTPPPADPYNLQIRSEPVAYPNGRAKTGAVEMVSALQYSRDGVTFVSLTATYANVFPSSQPPALPPAGRDHVITYRQCADWADAPGVYTIVVDYLGVQAP